MISSFLDTYIDNYYEHCMSLLWKFQQSPEIKYLYNIVDFYRCFALLLEFCLICFQNFGLIDFRRSLVGKVY